MPKRFVRTLWSLRKNGCAIFPPALIKHETLRLNQKSNLPRDTKQRIHTIVTINGWNTHFVHILRKECDGKFQLKGKILSRLPKLLNYHKSRY